MKKLSKARKGLYVLSWIPPALLFFFLYLLGWVIVPFMLRWSSGGNNRDIPRWFPYGNDEEGCPNWWFADAETGEEGKLAKWFPRWWWFAQRNPVNNHRYWFKDREATVEGWQARSFEARDLIVSGDQSASRWSYNGAFAGYRHVRLNKNKKKYSEFWFGWKVGSPIEGLGFTAQLRPNRKVGT